MASSPTTVELVLTDRHEDPLHPALSKAPLSASDKLVKEVAGGAFVLLGGIFAVASVEIGLRYYAISAVLGVGIAGALAITAIALILLGIQRINYVNQSSFPQGFQTPTKTSSREREDASAEPRKDEIRESLLPADRVNAYAFPERFVKAHQDELEVLEGLLQRKPLGIRNAGGGNCAFNALSHMIYFNPHIRGWLTGATCPRELARCQAFMRIYARDQAQGRRLIKDSSRNLRRDVYLLSRGSLFPIHSQSFRHEDAAEILSCIMNFLPDGKNRDIPRSPLYVKYKTVRYLSKDHPMPADMRADNVERARPTGGFAHNRCIDDWGLIAVPIMGQGKLLTFGQCLTTFFKDTRVCGNGTLKLVGIDGKTHEYGTDKIEIIFQQPPPVLTIHLKRFVNHHGRRTFMSYITRQHIVARNKITDAVEVPETFYIAGRFMSAADRQHYRITSFVYHSGSLNGGHYIGYVKDSVTGMWWKIDDSVATPMDTPRLLDQVENHRNHAYIYQFERYVPPADEEVE